MSALVVLIAVSLSVAVGFLIAYIRAARQGQFDDMETPALRVLGDEPASPGKTEDT